MFCTKCGYQIKDGYKFCPKCGTPVYVEKEKVESEAKVQEEERKQASKKVAETETDTRAKPKNTTKPKATTSSKNSSGSSTPKQRYIPNPFMAKELDIDGVKMRSEQGDRKAMSLQCFRYEMGIGTDCDMEKYNELKELGAVSFGTRWVSLFYYSKELATPYIATKNK